MRNSVQSLRYNKLIEILRAESKNHKLKRQGRGEKRTMKLVEMEEEKTAGELNKTMLFLEPHITHPFNYIL